MLSNLGYQDMNFEGTGEFHRLGRCFADWATAVAGEADRELTCVTFTYRGNGPIYETSAQSMELSGTSRQEI